MAAFVDGLTSVVAGNSAATTAQFIVPSDFKNLGSGYINYYLIDANNVVYSNGLGTNYQIVPVSGGNKITADFSITVPSDIPVNLNTTRYQVKFELVLPDEDNQVFYIYDIITVKPASQVALGAQDTVELYGSATTLSLVTEVQADAPPTCILYIQNTELASGFTAGAPLELADGYEYEVSLNTSAVGALPSLVPYSLMWTYAVNGQTFHESASVYVITPSMHQAIKDILLLINKSRANLGYQPVYSEMEIISFLRQGADLFNTMHHPTNFTMTNAAGPVRFLWLQCSAIIALRSQFLMEGESSFNFSGQAISLDVDRTQYYEGLASSIENSISEPMRQLKVNLSKRGMTSGDGNVNPNALAFNAMGSLGISASPVSNMRVTGLAGWTFGTKFGW